MPEKHYEAKEAEAAMQRFWEEEQFYRFNPEGCGETYAIDTPPPTVSGHLHIGHIFSYTQAEIIARFRRMQGYNVFYPFGFDDNGLPSERLVEKERKLRATDLPRTEFTALCRETTAGYIDQFEALWKSMGFSVDWSLRYDTISPLAQKISQRSFIRLAKCGKAYRKETPVLWCPCCRTSIAQAELETKEVASAFSTIPFTAGGETIPIATTRPELLYGCVALFVHPDDKRYRRFVGTAVTVPLYNFEIPVLADEQADMDKGTGAVMCATFGDTTDLAWYNKHKLPYKRVIEPDGSIYENVPYIGGLQVTDARKAILSLLHDKGLLLKSEEITHTVSVHERCGREIEILPSRQWFIDILTEKERFLAAADEIKWHPASMKKRYLLWVQNLKWDWCISRQRYFGVPFPVWYCKSCGNPVFAEESALPVNPMESAPEKPCACGCTDFVPETAVFDTWATSSLTPFINAHYGEPDERPILPMAMRTQAHEIIRTWAFYSIVRSIYETGQVPWKELMICGFVLAKKGEKLSKSKCNAADSPTELIARHSADSLRYWAAGAHLGTDTMFSEEELKLSGRFLTKLYNAAKFAFSRLEDYDGKETEMLPIDCWILARCHFAQREAEQSLYAYEIGDARQTVDALFWKDFCDCYLELAKERLYAQDGSADDASARYALYNAFLLILKLYAPIVPHITEFLYQRFYRQREKTKSVHIMVFSRPPEPDAEIFAFGETVKQVLFEVRRYKSSRGLSLKAEIGSLEITAPAREAALLQESVNDLSACCCCKTVRITKGDTLEIRVNTLC